MLEVRPLVVADGVVVGGNMRLLAMKDLGFREVSVIDVTEWTQEKRDEFMIKDNLSFGDWDYDLLANEWNIDDLTDWGMDLWDTEVEEMQTEEDTFLKGIKTFIAVWPPKITPHPIACFLKFFAYAAA